MKVYRDGNDVIFEDIGLKMRVDIDAARQIAAGLPYIVGEDEPKRELWQVYAYDVYDDEGYTFQEFFSSEEYARSFQKKLDGSYRSDYERVTLDNPSSIRTALDTRTVYFVDFKNDDVTVKDYNDYRETEIIEYLSAFTEAPYVNSHWDHSLDNRHYSVMLAANSESEAIILAKEALDKYLNE